LDQKKGLKNALRFLLTLNCGLWYMTPIVSFMKKTLAILAVLAALARSAQADFYTTTFSSGFVNSGSIPDGSLIGTADTRTLSGISFNTISDVDVRLTISGSWNGDLYGYLVHDSGFSVLLNRVGRTGSSSFGYSDSGFAVTFNDQATRTVDFHVYQTESGYSAGDITGGASWKPDGRNIDPTSSGATFDSTTPSALLSSFNGLNPNGSWTLFLADVSGGAPNTLVSWGLDITGTAAVPEPASIIEGGLAALVIGTMVWAVRLRKLQAPLRPC
jgi:subtilisin-like proprotein convertase family protein